MIPKANCKETKYLVILSLLLVLRTYMSIWLADVNGKIVKAIVDRNFKKFCLKVSKSVNVLFIVFFVRYWIYYCLQYRHQQSIHHWITFKSFWPFLSERESQRNSMMTTCSRCFITKFAILTPELVILIKDSLKMQKNGHNH